NGYTYFKIKTEFHVGGGTCSPVRHFTDIVEDQFDFHTYCVRRMTLRAYMKLLRLEDILRRHTFYYKAAKCAIKIYLRLHDVPYDDSSAADGNAQSDADSRELRKQFRKQKKLAVKAELERQKHARAAVTNPKHRQEVDPDEMQHTPLDPVVLVKYNDEFLERNRNSVDHRLIAARGMYFLDESRQKEAVAVATSLDVDSRGITWKACWRVLKHLSSGKLGACDSAVVTAYMHQCHARFPLCSAFVDQCELLKYQPVSAPPPMPPPSSSANCEDHFSAQDATATDNSVTDELMYLGI
ncbi:unnamed protein product, partial [Soboliphyme baturini]|uniref:PIPK domain-containing protein n=1 Tax=Soboliphyme baturini TaxID=241478 RepID=A0A183IQW5_9BILA